MILSSIVATFGCDNWCGNFGACGSFLAELAPKKFADTVRPAVELLAGIPSIVYGLLGAILIVPMVKNIFNLSSGASMLSAIIVLTIMVLPTIISISETSLRAVPREYNEASLALGATQVQTIFKILIPAARSGLSYREHCAGYGQSNWRDHGNHNGGGQLGEYARAAQ